VKGLVIGGVLFVIALLLLARGWTLQLQDRALAKRLVAVRARVTDQGSDPIISYLPQPEGPTRQDIDYEGQYEYIVGGTRYTGKTRSAAPVFRNDQMPPAEVIVFYDSADPSVSRMNTSADSNWSGYVLFSAIVFIVAVCIAVIPNLESILSAAQRASSTVR
jgi:hypothetical protein